MRDLYSSFKYCFYPTNFKGVRVGARLTAFASWVGLKCIFVESYKKRNLSYSFNKHIDFTKENCTSSACRISRNIWETQLNFWSETLEFRCCIKHTFCQSYAYTSLLSSSLEYFILVPSQASLFFFPFLDCYLFLSVKSLKKKCRWYCSWTKTGELVWCNMAAFILSSYLIFEDLLLHFGLLNFKFQHGLLKVHQSAGFQRALSY